MTIFLITYFLFIVLWINIYIEDNAPPHLLLEIGDSSIWISRKWYWLKYFDYTHHIPNEDVWWHPVGDSVTVFINEIQSLENEDDQKLPKTKIIEMEILPETEWAQ